MSTNNPYQTPEGQLTTDDQAVGEISFFSPSSRINRLRYWAHGALFAIGFYAILAVGGGLFAFVSPWVGVPIMAAAYIGLLVFSVIVMIQRLHDLNKTGWMWLLALVPFANIYLLIILIFFKGTPGRNNYGLQTPPNKTWHWVVALGFPVLALVLVLAFALPAYNQYMQTVQQDFSGQYDQSQSDTYPSEYTEEGAVEDTTFSDEALEDGISYETPEENIIEDDVIDAVEAETIEETDSETPQ
ncbi:MAG: DUF805 domain-containing protein [Cellvibrio sp.]|uniref:DUF805 domain-containing protein n=1 Tax=Cellvibrio sp. TaxID=1965322 RepID=UPI00271D5C56|nr:DUF805 domain-containing protein [Cellvibrio sp.]